MLTIESAEVKYSPRFEPQMHVSFIIDLDAIEGKLDGEQYDLARIIGQEVLTQAMFWYRLTQSSEDDYGMV